MRIIEPKIAKTPSKTARFWLSILIWALIAGFWFSLWLVISLIVGLKVIFPSPIDTIIRFFELFGEGSFYRIVFGSILRVIVGTLIAFVLGVLLAALSSAFKPIKKILSPLLVVIKTTPVVSFIIVAFLWIGNALLPSFISILMVFPIVYTNVLEGIESVPSSEHDLAKVFNFSFFTKVKAIYYPNVKRMFLAAMRTSIGLAWKAGIAAEVLVCTQESIGLEIYNAKTYLETVDLFAWTLLVIILSILIEFGFSRLFMFLSKEKGEER